MEVYRISKCNYINDLSGTGASLYPGRWNSKNVRMLYTAQSASLATLETVVHIAGMRLSAAYCMIVLQIPNELIAAVLPDELPSNWNAYPAPEALRTIGDRFIQSNTHLALKVPSAIVPDDYNFLLNPLHLEFHRVKILQQRTYNFDGRLVR